MADTPSSDYLQQFSADVSRNRDGHVGRRWSDLACRSAVNRQEPKHAG
jgi:hypothetical protein